jgi:hypothetical protein
VKKVAIEGSAEVQTSQNHVPEDVDKAGRWSAQSQKEEYTTLVSTDGKRLVTVVTATWKYLGGQVNGKPLPPLPPITDTATLRAKQSPLTDSGQSVLLVGDEATGTRDSANRICIQDLPASIFLD